MVLFNRLILWSGGLILFILLELLIKYPQLIFWLVSLMNLAVFFVIWQLTGRQFQKIKFWNFLITPILLLNSGWLFLIFLERNFAKQLFIVALASLLLLFLKVTFLYFSLRPKYQVHALENISSYLNLITVFLFSASFFSLLILLGLSFIILFLIALVIIALLTYQLFLVSEISLEAARPHIFIITLVIGELFMAVKFLPTSIYVNSLLISVGFYLTAGLSRNWLMEIKETAVVKRYLIISFTSIVIILITAKWI